MAETLRSKMFWISFILIAGAIFLAFLNTGKVYEAEYDILILPKSQLTSQTINQIASNAAVIPRSLSFYDKLLEENGDIINATEEMPAYKRKNYWNDKLHTEKVDGSSVVKIIITDQNQAQAQTIAAQTTRDIINILSRYFNIKTDLDIRIIDGPVVRLATKQNTLVSLPISILLGIFLSFLISRFSMLFEKPKNILKSGFNFPEKTTVPEEMPYDFSKKDFYQEQNQKDYVFQKNIPNASEEPKEEDEQKTDPSPLPAPSENEIPFKKSSAPDNLPVASNNLTFAKSQEPKEEKEAAKDNTLREATPEEVKERLNKLLSGKF